MVRFGSSTKKKSVLRQKIIIRQTADKITAAFDDKGFFVLNSIHVLKLKDDSPEEYKYVLGIINSKLCNFVYQQLTQEEGRVFAEVKPKNIRKLYILKIAEKQKHQIIGVVSKIISTTRSEDYLENRTRQVQGRALEKQIDQMVYQLYGLTEEEIRIVEGEK